MRSIENCGRKINILHITEQLPLGGAENLLLTLARNIDRNRFNLMFCCLDEKGIISNMISEEGFKVICLKVPRFRDNYKKMFRLASLIMREKIDIVHTHLHRANYIGRLIAYLSGVNIICKSEHGYGGDYRQQNIINIPKYMKRNMILDHVTDAIIYVSEAQLRNSGNRIPSKKKYVIYNGFDTERFKVQDDRSITRKSLGLSDEDIVIGVITNLNKYKGLIYLFQALKKLVLSYPSAKLLVIGEGPEELTLKNAIEDLGIESNVMFLACRKDVPELMRSLDIMVLPSLFESFGVVVIEAMYSGLPVVATNVGGIPEVVIDGETGILIPPIDSGAIAKALIYLIENPHIAKEMGKKGKEVVLSRFTGKIYAKKLEELYISLLTEKKYIKGNDRLDSVMNKHSSNYQE